MCYLDGEVFHVLAPNLLFFVTATREVVFRRFGLIAQRFRSPSVVAVKPRPPDRFQEKRGPKGAENSRSGAIGRGHAGRRYKERSAAGKLARPQNGVKTAENSLNLRDDLCHKNSWN